MPDWERLIADRLAGSGLAPEVQREVVAEIAAHLEEGYLELCRAGHADAEQQMLAQVSDWRALCRNIRRSKENPMSFMRNVVVPGVAAAILSQAALRLCVYLLITPEPCGPDMTCIAITAEGPAYLPWLATLPLAGATAAWLARLAGARSMQRLLAAVSPALYLGVQTLIMSILDAYFWRIPIYWVVIPAIACAIGAAPFLGGRRDPDTARPVALTDLGVRH